MKNNQAYQCGRLFAVLEKLQQKATKSRVRLSTRYFSLASTAPESIFGSLIKNSHAHVSTVSKKVSEETANYYSKTIGEIAEELDYFPTALDLKGQAKFSLGYLHQLQGVARTKEERKIK